MPQLKLCLINIFKEWPVSLADIENERVRCAELRELCQMSNIKSFLFDYTNKKPYSSFESILEALPSYFVYSLAILML